jgi:hypothetical protein
VEFLSRTQIITALGAVVLAVIVLDLVRRRRLSEEYSVLWALSTVTIAVLGFCTPLLRWITRALGVVLESSTVFAVGLAFTVMMLLYLSVRMSRLTQENQVLTRELALLRHEIEQDGGARRGGAA